MLIHFDFLQFHQELTIQYKTSLDESYHTNYFTIH